nr:hypothetical protein [Tanacetum cinerariifolium]
QEWDALVEETVIDEDEFKKAEEYAYHLEQTSNFMKNQIVWESRQEDHENTEEKKYILSLHKIHTEHFPKVDLEEKINRWVQKEFKTFNEDARWELRVTNSRVNLTAPTLAFPGVEAYEPYSIVDKPTTSLIYLNSKDEKHVMYLTETMKFCDATLEKVLKEGRGNGFQPGAEENTSSMEATGSWEKAKFRQRGGLQEPAKLPVASMLEVFSSAPGWKPLPLPRGMPWNHEILMHFEAPLTCPFSVLNLCTKSSVESPSLCLMW